MNMVQGKIIVVSGAANGIGASITRELILEGAHPICIDKESFEGSELSKLLVEKTLGTDFSYIHGDAGDESAMEKAFKSIDKVDGLVNNAGLLGGDFSRGGRSLASLEKMFQAHVYPALVLTELCQPHMTKGGSIVNIGSIELTMASKEVVLYSTAKGALWGMTISYAISLASKNIRVNMVSPGDVSTQRNIAQYADSSAGLQYLQGYQARTPLGKQSVTPGEVAKAVLVFLSDYASAITGQNQVVDRGYTRLL